MKNDCLKKCQKNSQASNAGRDFYFKCSKTPSLETYETL